MSIYKCLSRWPLERKVADSVVSYTERGIRESLPSRGDAGVDSATVYRSVKPKLSQHKSLIF